MSEYNKHTVDRLTEALRGTSVAAGHEGVLRTLILDFLEQYAGEAMRTPGGVLRDHFQAWCNFRSFVSFQAPHGYHSDPEQITINGDYQPPEDMQAYYARVRAVALQD